MKLAPALALQGTASDVGKSVLVAALCRIYARRGFSVAPFKAQNMALNAAIAADGGEIGRAQAVQAQAAGVAPSVHMNPILLKPEGNLRSQIVVRGKVAGTMRFGDYHDAFEAAHGHTVRDMVVESLQHIRRAHELVFIEGAGSPAEINLRDRDLANMFTAQAADASVLLVGDINPGGVFASLVGTLQLLNEADRARVKGLIINKFRGDARLLEGGLKELSELTGKPMIGVVPFVRDLGLPEEDSVALDSRRGLRRASPREVEITVVDLPALSNFDDFQPLERSPGVWLRLTREPRELADSDLVIVPGSKRTLDDLQWLRKTGFDVALTARAARGEPILGICGGCQILGQTIIDEGPFEAAHPTHATGLGLLPLRTVFGPDKRAVNTVASVQHFFGVSAGLEVPSGYEIHAGQTSLIDATEEPAFRLHARNGEAVNERDGAVRGSVVGTMLHGLFESAGIRDALLRFLAERSSRDLSGSASQQVDPFDTLADHVEAALDMAAIDRLLGVSSH